MCRLFGWATPQPRSAEELLGPDIARLAELSQLHRDGWGAAWFGPAGMSRHREDIPAYSSDEFSAAMTEQAANVGVLHLRWATEGIPVCLENTHPFVRDGVAFIHNGSVPDKAPLEGLIDPDLRSTMEGENDSERYFLAVLSAYRRLGSVPEAFAEVLLALADEAYPSLNAMWAEADRLVVVSAYQNEFKGEEFPADYYPISYGSYGTTTMAWSSGVFSGRGFELANFSALVVDAATGVTTTQPLR